MTHELMGISGPIKRGNDGTQRGARTQDPESHALPTELSTHVEFGALVFVRSLLLYHLLLIATTLGRSELIILTKQELTCHLEARCLSPAVFISVCDHFAHDELCIDIS